MNRFIHTLCITQIGLQLGLGAIAFAAPAHLMAPSTPDVATSLKTFLHQNSVETNVFKANEAAGTKAKSKDQPWSGSYWPLYLGSIGNAYPESRNTLSRYSRNHAKYLARMEYLRANFNSLDEATIDNMAPSEKYDVYLGDADFTLTNSIWTSVQEHADAFKGAVQMWEGSCQGWSSASIYTPRPENAIRVMSLDGKRLVSFYPDDLKALATILWANSRIQLNTPQFTNVVFAGQNCQSKYNRVDVDDHGRATDMTCLGVNPGVFHLAILNTVGVKKGSFVMNRVNDKEVWNQPVTAYELDYFDPTTGDRASLEQSIVDYSNVYDDPFAAYRAKGTKYLVGVDMDVSFLSETAPSHQEQDTPRHDRVKKMYVRYDLELNDKKEIIGGEWRNYKDQDPELNPDAEPFQATYPGFIWNFAYENPVAWSIADFNAPKPGTADFTSSKILPFAKQAANYREEHVGTNGVVWLRELKPQPLGNVVYSLIEASRKEKR